MHRYVGNVFAVGMAALVVWASGRQTDVPLSASGPGGRLSVPLRDLARQQARRRNTGVSGAWRQLSEGLHGWLMPSLAATTSLNLNFDGIVNGSAAFNKDLLFSSTNGDVGPNHYVQAVNTAVAVYSKNGTLLAGPTDIHTLWTGYPTTDGNDCGTSDDTTPLVLYDRIADRWVISRAPGIPPTSAFECIAVSQTSDPTGSYHLYDFRYSGLPVNPRMAVWSDAYYMTFDQYTVSGANFIYAGALVCAYDRAKMIAGLPATQACLSTSANDFGLLPSHLNGSRLPPAGSPNYLVAIVSPNQLGVWKFHVDWVTPANTTLTGPTVLSIPFFSTPCGGNNSCIPQTGTVTKLDPQADRLMNRLAYRNFGDHEALFADHTIVSGTATGIRWYEIQPGATPSIVQSGTFDPGDGVYRWMGSLAVDQAGNVGLGFNRSSASVHPGLAFTGRAAADAAGTMGAETILVNGAGSDLSNEFNDFDSMAIDPSDDCTFWFTGQYYAADGNVLWRTRIATFKFSGCGAAPANDFAISASPGTVSVAQGNSGNTTINTAVTLGAAQTVSLSITGLPTGASASFAPTAVSSGGSSTLTLTAGAATPSGSYAVTVTGTGTAAAHSTVVTFVVNPSTFSLAADPAALSLGLGGVGIVTINTAPGVGTPPTVSLSISGLPSGASATFTPSSLTAGSAATLVISAGTAAPGSYPLTVSGTAGPSTTSATVSLTITTNPGNVGPAGPAGPAGAQGPPGDPGAGIMPGAVLFLLDGTPPPSGYLLLGSYRFTVQKSATGDTGAVQVKVNVFVKQ